MSPSPYVVIIEHTVEEDPQELTYNLEICDRFEDGTIDTFPDEDGVGAICHPDGTADTYVMRDGEAIPAGSAHWYESIP